MKITLDIPNEHTPRLLALLAAIMAVNPEPQADPTNVEMEPVAPVRNGDAELPFFDDFPELPPLPKGKTRWVYRGTFPEIPYGAGDRCYNSQIRFLNDGAWYVTNAFDGDFHHIEAI